MKSRLSAICIIVLSFTLSSCFLPTGKESKTKGDSELLDVKINNEYSMGVPTYMTKTTSLHEEAGLQFQNVFKEAYVIVIDEDKENFIKTFKDLGTYDSTLSVLSNYADIQVQSTSSRMNVTGKNELSTLKFNDLNASAIELDATVEGVSVPITYFLTFIEGNKKMYMVMAWTLKDNKDKQRGSFTDMVKTFKLI
jgi:hypothetical protein